jgi:hypothetical protein
MSSTTFAANVAVPAEHSPDADTIVGGWPPRLVTTTTFTGFPGPEIRMVAVYWPSAMGSFAASTCTLIVTVAGAGPMFPSTGETDSHGPLVLDTASAKLPPPQNDWFSSRNDEFPSRATGICVTFAPS